jgi:hypothetical protein
MTQVDNLDAAKPKDRHATESYNPWEEMFKTHYEAPKLDRSWTAPVDETSDGSAIQTKAS